MMKKRVFSFLAALCLVGSSIPAAASSRYDVRFESEEYEYFYPASSAEIRHDGHGEFWVEDTIGTIASNTGTTAVIRPDAVTVTEQIPAYSGSWQGESGAGIFTPSSAILQNGGILGTLQFLGNTVTVYEGTSNSSMAKGAGHFTGTSVWNGNVVFAGHNRGSHAWFYDVKDLRNGDTITYSTSLGTRQYCVTSVRIISVNDFTPLAGSSQNNRRVDRKRLEESLLLPPKGDKLDGFRGEYNRMLLSQAAGNGSSLVQERYLTVSDAKRNIEEARSYFSRIGSDLLARLAQLSSFGRELDAAARLQILHDFFHDGKPAPFGFDLRDQMRKGHSFKDWFCPDSMEFHKDCFQIDDRWGRVLYLQDYANYIRDAMIAELCDLDRSLMLSIDILPVPTDEAVKEIQNRLLGIQTNIANWQRRQNANQNFSATVPYDMEQQQKETTEVLDDLTTRDQRMMFGLVTLVHMADTKKQLDSDTETILSAAGKNLCRMSVLRWQQKDGLDTALPYGVRKIHALRSLTTESAAVLIPFRAQEILHEGGIYYGQNAVSKNRIVADRRKLLNGNSFRLGVSGSGKSFSAKEEIVSIALSTEDDILILDPESEFTFLTEALGGEVIHTSATSATHVNAMDMDKSYGDARNPLIEKSQFILSLFEQLVGAGNISAKEKSILDRCTSEVYRPYLAGGCKGEPPTLKDLYQTLLSQLEPEAHGLALSSELFITGSLNTFAQPTNVDTKARIIDYDIRELGEQLLPIGMLVTLDAIFNRVIQNWKKGKTTWIFADEIYLLFKYQYSAEFFYKLWKRIRKYRGLITGLTQNIDELLRSDTARLMLANSEFLVLLNQSATDRDELAKLLHISETQLSYITNVPAGCGLIRCAGNIVPFENSFPKNTQLYKLMTTKPDEALREGS